MNIKIITGCGVGDTLPLKISPEAGKEFAVEFEFPASNTWSTNDWLVLDCESDIRSALKMIVSFLKDGESIFEIDTYVIGARRLYCPFPLSSFDGTKVWLPIQPGLAKTSTTANLIDVKDVDSVRVSIKHGRDFKSFTIHGIDVTPTLPDLNLKGKPAVDRLGQCTDFDFNNKTHSEQEMIEFLKSEYEWAKTHDFYPNDDFDEYGGYKKLNFGKKGHFYTHHDGSRHWLVDPLGNAFFSLGACYANRAGVFGLTYLVENMFEELPDFDDELLGEAWCYGDNIPEYVKRQGLDEVKNKKLFNFARANYIRAFGKNWHEAYTKITSARLKQWGFNTIGVGVNDYVDEKTAEFLKGARIPYCVSLKVFPKTRDMIFRDFPDVFSEEYRALSVEYARQLAHLGDDPYFMGYFITNEPEWMFHGNRNIAGAAFDSDKNTATKLKLIEILREKYSDISALNSVWGTSFAAFESLKTRFDHREFKGADCDFEELMTILVRKYSDVPTEELEKVAPGAINLGMRYGDVSSCNLEGNDRFDVFSFNCYSRRFGEVLKGVDEVLHRAFILGEWHIGASDGGLMSNALVNATTQDERGRALAEYMRKGFVNDKCVGMHYFEYNDQPLLGRFDGENMQIGLVDVCGKPYYDCIKHFSKRNLEMYDILTGKINPPEEKWQFDPKF